MNKSFIWLSFDLGIQGDYEGLYNWLDTHHALECGDSLAGLDYEYDTELIEELKKDIQEYVRTDKKTRIYLIRPESGKMKGRFIFGNRKNAPWSGYGQHIAQEEDDGI